MITRRVSEREEDPLSEEPPPRLHIGLPLLKDPMANFIDVQLGGNDFRLLAGRGLYWHEQSALFVADAHLGKEATFRAHGIPVPTGSTDGTLARITQMLNATGAKQLFILGDMFHAASSFSKDFRASLQRFCDSHVQVELTLVRGNHDVRASQLLSDWPICVIEEGVRFPRVAIGHHPGGVPAGADIYLCGHLHPAIRVSSREASLGKFPCFWYSKGCLVLPAIGEFTGTHVIRNNLNDQVWIVVDDEVMKFPF
jgi:uncharacterized protein